MPPTTGDPDEVQLGPGILHVAPIGTTEPTSASATLPSAWREIGWTEEGSTFTYELTTEDVPVAEEFDPVKVATTARTVTVAFQMAQSTRENLALALNAGANADNDGSSFEPPTPGSETRVMIVWTSDDSEPARRWIFRRCFQSGSVEMARQKAPNKTLLPVEFRLEKPEGSAPFKVFPNANGLI